MPSKPCKKFGKAAPPLPSPPSAAPIERIRSMMYFCPIRLLNTGEPYFCAKSSIRLEVDRFVTTGLPGCCDKM